MFPFLYIQIKKINLCYQSNHVCYQHVEYQNRLSHTIFLIQCCSSYKNLGSTWLPLNFSKNGSKTVQKCLAKDLTLQKLKAFDVPRLSSLATALQWYIVIQIRYAIDIKRKGIFLIQQLRGKFPIIEFY